MTDTSYKMFMKIAVGEKIEEHLEENSVMKDNQNSYTKGGRIEHNLLILQYCIENAYMRKKPLIVTAVDYKKAFDSIKREEIIKTLMKYKVNNKVIDVVAKIYYNDSTNIKLGNEEELTIKITNGIKQGCTGSTTLFKLITYMIMTELEEKGTGFQNEEIKLSSLYFADDGLILSPTLEDTKKNIQLVTEISRKYGLELNKDKSNTIIYNMKEQPEAIEDIQVVKETKYLGVKINNTRKIFGIHKKEMLKKAQKLANATYSIIERSCNKLMVGKAYWKNLALPSILHGIEIINLTEQEINKLQTIENSVYRKILNAPSYATNSSLRGEPPPPPPAGGGAGY